MSNGRYLEKPPLVLFTTLMLLAPSSWAEELIIAEEEQHPIVQWTEECLSKDNSTANMQKCLTEAHQKWDKELDDVSKTLTKQLDEKAQVLFKEAQDNWLKYRDSEFKLIDAAYGTLEDAVKTPVLPLSKIAIIKNRVAQLDSYVDVLAGDLQEVPEEIVTTKPCVTYTAEDSKGLITDINHAYEQGYQLLSTLYIPKSGEGSKTAGQVEVILCKPVP